MLARQVTVAVRGEKREICHYGILGLRKWVAEDRSAIHSLLDDAAAFFERESRAGTQQNSEDDGDESS